MASNLILIFTVLIMGLIDLVTGEISSASACFNKATKIDIQCPERTMLRIHRVFFGYSPDNHCSYSPGDCTYTEHENYPCVGKERCSINLPSGGFGRKIPSCKQESNYFQVDYECVPVAIKQLSQFPSILVTRVPHLSLQLHLQRPSIKHGRHTATDVPKATNSTYMTRSICNVEDLRDQSGYLASPGYPNNYPANLDCAARIRVNPNQSVKLFVIDMDLETNVSIECTDYLYARDETRSVTLCARRANEPIPIQWGELFIQLVSNGIENHKGFWMYYEADPPLPKPTTPSVQRTTPDTQREGQAWEESEDPLPMTRTDTLKMQTKESKLPFVAIIGGVIGTLSFILIVLLVLLGLKWLKERRRRMDKNRFIEVQNPAYRNSTEFRNVPNDNFYNYIDC
uniref:Cubilin n=2 Tax=Magallana gigas TaxID=29159 RepID=K1R4I8_MAGGI